jgi:hypothetical protein
VQKAFNQLLTKYQKEPIILIKTAIVLESKLIADEGAEGNEK